PSTASRSGPSVREAIRSSQADSSRRASSGTSAAKARIRLVLPIPASPVTRTTEPCPTAASLTARERVSCVCSRSRSTEQMVSVLVRSVEGSLAFGDREALLVQRLAHDHAGEIDLPEVGERLQVLAAADATRVQEAAAHRLGDPLDLLGVRPFERPVAVGVGVDERRNA